MVIVAVEGGVLVLPCGVFRGGDGQIKSLQGSV